MSDNNAEKEVKINEKTLIPLSLMITIIGGVYWLSNLNFKANASEKEIEKLNKKITVIQSIDTRLSRIEGALNISKTDQGN